MSASQPDAKSASQPDAKLVPQPYAMFAVGIVAMFAVVSFGTTAAFGQERGSGPRQGPPEEAFSACENLDEGDACSVETREGTLEGTCRTPPRGDDRLVCVPAGGPPGRGR